MMHKRANKEVTLFFYMKLEITVNYPHCYSAKIVKNGVKKSRKQNFLCKGCNKQFILNYKKIIE